jgi:lipid-A-disaccharide synthase
MMVDGTTTSGGMVFTAFEPSGDTLAAAVITELKTHRPDIPIFAWAGPRTRDAGAEIIEESVHASTIGGVTLAQIREHFALRRRFKDWLAGSRVRLHVPVDSPAANFPLCKISRQAGCRIAHLAAPQLWAWAPWRIRKLRRLTDLVLCLLPFEETYFQKRRVPAVFIGHPLMAEKIDRTELDRRAAMLPQGRPKIVLLPGSRANEIRRHVVPMLNIFDEFRAAHPNASGVMVAANERIAQLISERASTLPDGLLLTTGHIHSALHWADLAVVCSGTVTLETARFHLPMIVMYRVPLITWYLIGTWLVRPRFFALPNLIADREIVPEFVPYVGGSHRIVELLTSYMRDPSIPERQRADLRTMGAEFHEINPPQVAADRLLALYDATSPTR